MVNVESESLRNPPSVERSILICPPVILLKVPTFHNPLPPGLANAPMVMIDSLLKVPASLYNPKKLVRSILIWPPGLLLKVDPFEIPIKPGLILAPILITPLLSTVPALISPKSFDPSIFSVPVAAIVRVPPTLTCTDFAIPIPVKTG